MTDLVEKIARAMYDANPFGMKVMPGWDREHAGYKQDFKDATQAALTAIREEYAIVPRDAGEEMLEAFSVSLGESGVSEMTIDILDAGCELQKISPNAVFNAYTAMIEAGEVK